MLRKRFLFILIALIAVFFAHPQATMAMRIVKQREKAIRFETVVPDISAWLIENQNSKWQVEEQEHLREILALSIKALDDAGLSGEELLGGYRFSRWDGEYAKDQEGKIALVNHTDREIILSDSIMAPENAFFIYHELGHVVNRRSGDALTEKFHGLTEQIDGIVIRHDWTTAEGYWIRGQAHIKRSEATADAFALWVLMGYGDEAAPNFFDTPESAQHEAIIRLFDQALMMTFESRFK